MTSLWMTEDEDIAIAKAIARASSWFDRVSCIEAIESHSSHGKSTKKTHQKSRTDVSDTYVCRRCNKSGHHITKCITNGDPAFDKPRMMNGAAGIPQCFIKNITAEEAVKNGDAFLRADGSYGVALSQVAVFSKYSETVQQAIQTRIPYHLTCGLCTKLIKEPLNFPCCQRVSFCKECAIPSDDITDLVSCPICNRECKSTKLTMNVYVDKEATAYRQQQNAKKRAASQDLYSHRGEKVIRRY